MFKNKQFIAFIAVTVPLFVVGVFAADGMGLGPKVAFTAGFVLSIPIEFVRDWFIDWYEAEQKTNLSQYTEG